MNPTPNASFATSSITERFAGRDPDGATSCSSAGATRCRRSSRASRARRTLARGVSHEVQDDRVIAMQVRPARRRGHPREHARLSLRGLRRMVAPRRYAARRVRRPRLPRSRPHAHRHQVRLPQPHLGGHPHDARLVGVPEVLARAAELAVLLELRLLLLHERGHRHQREGGRRRHRAPPTSRRRGCSSSPTSSSTAATTTRAPSSSRRKFARARSAWPPPSGARSGTARSGATRGRSGPRRYPRPRRTCRRRSPPPRSSAP